MRIACFTSSLNNPRQRENRFLAFKCLISDEHVQNVFICYNIIICSEFGKKYCSVSFLFSIYLLSQKRSYTRTFVQLWQLREFLACMVYKSRKSNLSSIEQTYPFLNSCDIRMNMNWVLFSFSYNQ